MSSPIAAAELGIFDALSAGVTLAPVFQDVPDGTTAPIVILAELSGDPIGGKGSRSLRLSLTVTTEVWQEQRQPILDLQEEVRVAIDGRKLLVDGYEVTMISAGSEARQVGPAQYFGTSTFDGFVTPA
ncbi:hypothetical protein EWE75_12080 [Sphingomonas populi]|uniref:DUF3168 domain-containing protein n=1 Tax=Sphingomonas populi TaxID=2484750 RepID=A0A4Q6Y4H6_9SPHN|nr:hypothetical protein [Sphingomonas populi]RZF64277.1 hypothetical protein EWE75_12080 [Sphingomonas populi]